MTAGTPSVPMWTGLPGWGIAADLTPPELTNARQLALLRRWLAGALILLLLVCVGGYVLASRQHDSASSSLTQVQDHTLELQAGVRKYAGVTQIQGTLSSVEAAIATLMASDVDLVTVIGRIRTSLPGTMTIASESVTISTTAVAAASAASLDTSGLARIGAITLSGSTNGLDDLAAFVDKLKALPGVVDVLPTSNTMASNTGQFTLILGLTSALISHRFDVAPAVTK